MKTLKLCVLSLAACQVSPAYDLHEWGTFTTISGSDGVMLAGLQVEEERLPLFVQGHNHLDFRGMKSIVRPVANVRVKMETPVIYFYGDKREKVSVHVGFDGGTISQWYPPRTSGDVLPLTLTVDSAETLTMDFKGKEKVPFALAFERVKDKVRYKVFSNGLAANSQTQIEEEGGWVELPMSMESDRTIYKEMRAGLMDQGLTQHEADGMVKTWWNSYFGHEGLRVFWILPQNEVERILPMKVKPAPDKQVRVIVGRSEVLRPRFEKQLLAQAAKAEAEKRQFFSGGRYYLAHKERVEALRKLAKK